MTRGVLVGLIGANIQSSLSPALHEDALAVAGLRGHYHLMDLDQLPGRRLESLLDAVRVAGFSGVNITYPCKEAVVPLLDEVSQDAREIGAVNTVVIAADGSTTGYNTDVIGFRRGFEETFGAEAVRGKVLVLVGAGGAGRAVAFSLLDLGVEALLVHDRDGSRARSLVAALEVKFGHGRARLEDDPVFALRTAAGVVNATPVGMVGMSGSAVPLSALEERHLVADVIYTPLETRLVTAAKAKGARAMGGAGMCVHQAAEAFRLFTGLSADVDRMRRTFVAAAALRERDLADTG